MIRTIVTPQNNNLTVSIPNNYIGKEIEVLLYSKEELGEEIPKQKKKMSDFWGTLSDQTATEMLQEVEQGRKEWDERLQKQF
jgi:hypothetical protein